MSSYEKNSPLGSLPLEDLEIYQLSMDIGDEVWNCVMKWDNFARFTVGRQWVDAVDSIAANISEGHGRFHFKDRRNFCYFARGSLKETKTWTQKAARRGLISEELAQKLTSDLNRLSVKLNNYIKSIGKGTRDKQEG